MHFTVSVAGCESDCSRECRALSMMDDNWVGHNTSALVAASSSPTPSAASLLRAACVDSSTCSTHETMLITPVQCTNKLLRKVSVE